MKTITLTSGQFSHKSDAWKEGFTDTLANPDNCKCPYRYKDSPVKHSEWQEANFTCIGFLNFLDTLVED